MVHALISIHPEHVARIAQGAKRVEIRGRKIDLPQGTMLWIYATRPLGQIKVVARIAKISYVSPTRAWEDFEHALGISKAEFRKYVNGSTKVSAVALTDVVQLREPLSLEEIKRSVRGFHPPQFFMRLDLGDPVYGLLSNNYPARFR